MSRAKIILFGGEKGGVGKSTITTNVAVELSMRNAEVIIIDTDPQKTSVNWVDRRNSNIANGHTKINAVSRDGNIIDIVQNFSQKYDVVLIDSSGRDSQSLRTGLTVADKFYCPIRASQADLETLPHVCDIITIAKSFNKNLECSVIVSCAPTNPMINEVVDATNLLKDFADYFSLSKIFIRERKIYRDALLSGNGVVELENNKACIEIKNLVDELLGDRCIYE